MKKWLSFALLFAVVFICGCTIPGLTGTSGGGPSMTLSVSDSTVDPGTQVVLTLLVQNNGGATATGISAQLNGLTSDWGISPGTNIGIQDLSGVDTSHGVTQGEADSEQWTLTPPALSTQISYPFSIKLTYNYDTSDNAVIRAVSYSYYKTHTNFQSGKLSESSTGGPISISLQSINAVFTGENSIPIYFDFNNAGSGIVQGNSLNVNVQGNGISCSKNTVTLIPDSTGVGRTGFLKCTLATSGQGDYPQFVISIDASYTYQIEQFSSITVLAKTS